eukprot:gnl/MRDRNA2_/MRDRNA2_85734_c0_seq1.p1 gnl/MRDRNA2_/MRDRNA2_85734_c0~~gnl/MRDRNA2_/MRDRNA2_85734_c0_seq1.p1  ORF type:complete len:231 (+),score=24.88 gnl/MRDRNA2_/MRDRNA2_85734_c0_seq1:959-1651(+)
MDAPPRGPVFKVVGASALGPESRVPSLKLWLRGNVVILKPVGWEVDTVDLGDGRPLSSWFWQNFHRSPIVHCWEAHFGFLHRLDSPSSGLIAASTTFEAHFALAVQLCTFALRRDYAVSAHGFPVPSLDQVCERIRWARIFGHATPSAMHAAGNLSADTMLCVLGYMFHECAFPICLVAIRINTGRRHQIRAHASGIGYPLVSEGMYALPAMLFRIPQVTRMPCQQPVQQ